MYSPLEIRLREWKIIGMLLCSTSADNKERDSFIRSRTVAKMEKLNVREKLQKMEAKMTEFVDKKVIEALKRTQDKFEKTYSYVLNAKTQKSSSKLKSLKHQNDSPKFDHNILQSFRMQGVAEDPKKTKGENLLSTTQKLNEMLNLIGEKPKNVEMK